MIGPVPESLKPLVAKKRKELVETVAEVDETLGELFLLGEEPSVEDLKAAIRRATIARAFAPVFMGSAFKTHGVQLLLDGVVDYLRRRTKWKTSRWTWTKKKPRSF